MRHSFFTLIELPVIKTCQIYNLFPYTARRKREGFGGEKAATCAASLPVPTNLNISFILRKPSRLCQCSASGKSEQKREVAFPQKSGKATSRYCGSSFSAERPLLRLSTVPYPAPAPCRTQGARGGGGHAPRIPPFKADHRKIYAYRVARSDCYYCDSGRDAAAGAEQSPRCRPPEQLRQQYETARHLLRHVRT